MEAELRDATGVTNQSDYCVALLYLGRTQEAVERLEKLEQEHPGQYFIAANLGTAYELAGRNEEALRWINEGIKRNPASHEGTEWLHAKILEAKLAQQEDSEYFATHSVLNLDPAKLSAEAISETQTMSLDEMARAIEQQLAERMQFVKPPDAAVASLLYDFAAIDARRNSLESATRVLQLAIEYGYPKARADALNQRFERRIFWATTAQYTLLAIAGGLLVWGLRVLRKRGKLVLTLRRPKQG